MPPKEVADRAWNVFCSEGLWRVVHPESEPRHATASQRLMMNQEVHTLPDGRLSASPPEIRTSAIGNCPDHQLPNHDSCWLTYHADVLWKRPQKRRETRSIVVPWDDDDRHPRCDTKKVLSSTSDTGRGRVCPVEQVSGVNHKVHLSPKGWGKGGLEGSLVILTSMPTGRTSPGRQMGPKVGVCKMKDTHTGPGDYQTGRALASTSSR